MAEEDFVYVPVPARWALHIYERLTELAAEEPEPEVTEEEPQDAADLDFETVARMYWESEHAHRRLLDLFAGSPGVWLYTPDIAERLQLPNGSRSVGGMFGAFGRRAKHRYEGRTPWDTEWDPARNQARHRMPATVASFVTRAAEEAQATGAAP